MDDGHRQGKEGNGRERKKEEGRNSEYRQIQDELGRERGRKGRRGLSDKGREREWKGKGKGKGQ